MRGIVGNPNSCRCTATLLRPCRRRLRYAQSVSSSWRRSSLVLLWLLLALLPLRGWANLTMHLPSQDASITVPCHDVDGQSTAEPADAAASCTLCDVCHGAVLLLEGSAPQGKDRGAQALMAALPAAVPAAEPTALFRPPRR
jgi:hypothetical protein